MHGLSESQILEKYGNVKLEFDSCNGCGFTYISENKKYKVCGQADYRSELQKEMTVGELWQELETFNFYFELL